MIKVSESLNGAIENFLEVTPQIQNHMSRRDNPHAVSKESIGLSNVLNEKQVTEEQYIAHINGQDKHRAEDIMYDDITLKEKVDSMGNDNTQENLAEEIKKIEAEAEKLRAEAEKIKAELNKNRVILQGSVVTDTFDAIVHLPLSGDERFVTSDGFLTMPQGGAARFECTVTVTDSTSGFSKAFVFEGVCMNCRGAVIYSVKADTSGAIGSINDDPSYNAYSEASINYDYGNQGIFVMGDDKPLYWKATVEIINFTQPW